MSAVEIAFWACAALLVHTHVAYPLLMLLLARLRPRQPKEVEGHEPRVTLIVAAHNEESVIGRKVTEALDLDYPADKLEIIVASDGSTDRTVAAALKAASASERAHVLDLPRGGKVRAQEAATLEAAGEILAFSDANSVWERDALRRLVAPFADPAVGYACGQVEFTGADSSQEGVYWRYEMALRRAESAIGSITAGNGAIYATRAISYVSVDDRMGHDLAFPFNMVKRGWRAVFTPSARASELMVPDLYGEFRRKRRMMSHAWTIVLEGGMLNPRGYGLLYLLQIASHRLLRYASPLIHAAGLGLNVALVVTGESPLYIATLALQFASLACVPLASVLPWRPVRLAAHYWLTTISSALGLWDHLRHGTAATWDPVEAVR
jgi:cellulose synthase/poly-beta-1,6-N-acetylglucosamine synthase-like glycosyltransferase